MNPRVISLDIETYGACTHNHKGDKLPLQSVFQPQRSLRTDKVSLQDLILTVAITLPKEDPRCLDGTTALQSGLVEDRNTASTVTTSTTCSTTSSTLPWNASALSQLCPGRSITLMMHRPDHRKILRQWLEYADTIIGMNLPFDISYLRALPEFRHYLHEQTLIDLSVINYLHDETRPERSLKTLGPVLRTHSYGFTLKHKRTPGPDDPQLLHYNAEDTHNTMLAVQELARRIIRDYPETDKLSPWCIDFYSRTIWSVIRMSENGVCMDTRALIKLEDHLSRRMDRIYNICKDRFNLLLSGTGSGKSRTHFLDSVVELVPEVLNDLALTPKTKEISFNDENRNLLLSRLERNQEAAKALRLVAKHTRAQKLVTSYTYPLLHHRRNHPLDRRSTILRHHVRPELVHPTWYVTPSPIKDGAGGDGGTLQGRITCKNPACQTFPKPIKRLIKSRWRGGTIVSFDLSQIELRVAALLSGEPYLVTAYLNGEDLHLATAMAVFGNPEYRQVGKMINFANLFRSSPNTMRNQVMAMTGLDIPIETFIRIARERPLTTPVLYQWQQDQISAARRDGYTSVMFSGQSRYFLGGDKWDENEIVNFPIQTTAGNVLLDIHHRFDRSMREWIPDYRQRLALPILNIYDAIVFDVSPGGMEVVEPWCEACADECQREGLWAMLQERTGNTVPLAWEFTR